VAGDAAETLGGDHREGRLRVVVMGAEDRHRIARLPTNEWVMPLRAFNL
jgi:hypothetical protein